MALKTVAVTGATGFVGRATLGPLRDAGWNIRALTRQTMKKCAGVCWIEGDLDQLNSLESLCLGADAVLHIAGVVNPPDPAQFEFVNVTGTKNMLNAAKEAGIRRFVHVSSLAARSPLLSHYGASKASAEKLVETSLLDWTIVRPPGVFGPQNSDVGEMFKNAERWLTLLPPRGSSSWIFVDDLARVLAAVLPPHEDATARIFEVDDGKAGGWAHDEFARAIGLALGRRVATTSLPKPIFLAFVRIAWLISAGKSKLTPDRARYMSHPNWVIDRQNYPPPALWKPLVDTREGLKLTARWYANKQ